MLWHPCYKNNQMKSLGITTAALNVTLKIHKI
jgi:hypothetical protein